MKQALIYTLKVWLTTVTTAPIIYSVILLVEDKQMIYNTFDYAGSWPIAYLGYSVIFIEISFIPWLCYCLTIWLLMSNSNVSNPANWLSTIVAEILLFLSFLALYFTGHGDVNFLFYLMLACFALVLAITTRTYKLANTTNVAPE